ncbi:MAG: PleD family two-component system response regulator [Acidobacteriota bacterium]
MHEETEALRILYIEDTPVTARVVQLKLQKAGFEVELAADGGEGLARCAEEDYEVVLLDKEMPVHDGLKVIRILSTKEQRPSSIMVTASGDEKAAVEAMKLGADQAVHRQPLGGRVQPRPLPRLRQEALPRLLHRRVRALTPLFAALSPNRI